MPTKYIGARSHFQDTPSDRWVIPNPSKRPVSVCVNVWMPDGKLHQVLPKDIINDPDAGEVIVIFPYPQTGQARLS